MGTKVKPDCFCLKSSVLNALGTQLSYPLWVFFCLPVFMTVGDLVSSGGKAKVRNRPLMAMTIT